MNRIARWICAVLLCVNVSAFGEEFFAKVIVVLDGDTVLIRRSNGLVKIRLAEIDAPEKAQAFGETSRHSLSDMVMGKQVKFVSETMDQYGRMVAHLNVDGLDVDAEQIRRGMAWEYSNFASLAASRQSLRDPPHSNKALIALQNEARQASRGLWAQSNPTPPWEWRLRHVTDKTISHSTGRTNNTRQVAGYGGASRLREQSPAAPTVNGGLHPSAQLDEATSAADHMAMSFAGCGNKRRCSEMSSCEEAKYYLAQCGVKSLDGNGDGTPCEQLCAPQKKIKD